MFSLSLASLSIFIVKSFFNHAYALVFISLWSCAMQARIPDRGNGDFFTLLILMKNTGECNASPLRHTAMPSLFRCQLPYTQAICASCLRKLLSCLHLSSDFSFPLLQSLHSGSNGNNDNPLILGEGLCLFALACSKELQKKTTGQRQLLSVVYCRKRH